MTEGRWAWLCTHALGSADPFQADLPGEDQAEGTRLWFELIAQREKLSARLSWLAENEGDPEFEERAAATTRSRLRFEDLLRALAAWAGVAAGDVAGLLLEGEAEGEGTMGAAPPTRHAARGETGQEEPQA